jgi:uncharacterized protein YjiS (DUF1127 family)
MAAFPTIELERHGRALCAPEGDIMFKLITFRSDGAFWPLAEPGDVPGAKRSGSLFAAMLRAPRRLAARILAELAARRAVQTLASLDERMLRDIGVERDQISHATRYGREAVLRSSDLRADFTRWA